MIERLRRSRHWLLLLLGAVAVALLPWSAYLGATLPSEHVAHHWRIAWTGLDLAEAAALVATLVALVRNSPAVIVLATIAGTLLICDAWFDVVAAQPGSEFAWALVFAVLAELPLAALCFWIAFEADLGGATAAEELAGAADPQPTGQPARRAEGRSRART